MRFMKSITLILMLSALVLVSGSALYAGGGSSKVNMYFHGSDTCSKLGSHTMHLIVKYDGKQVMSRDFRSNSGFGGFTVTDVDDDGDIYVNMKIYDRNGTKVAEKTWDHSFGNGTHNFNLEGNPRYWAVYMDFIRNGTDVLVRFG